MKNIPSLIRKIQSVLSDDLLHKDQKKTKKSHPYTGHCYVASEALYHILGGKKSGLTPVRATLFSGTSHTHWWLKDENRKIIDITAEQFTSRGINVRKKIYPYGRGTGFLTKGPSKRAQEVIRRVKKLDR